MSDGYGGPPQYGADPYGWGSTPYPAAPPPAPYGQPVPPPPPVRTRRVHPAILIVAGIVVAAVALGLLVATLAGGDTVDAPGTGGRRLAIPAEITGFSPVPGVHTDDLKASLGDDIAQKGDDPEDVVRHAAVGVFERQESGARVIFLGIALRDVPSFRSGVRSDGVEASLKFFLGGASEELNGNKRTEGFPPGPLKGFLRCTSGKIDGTPASACAWGDESAFALTIITDTVALGDAAEVTRTLRAAIERE